MVGEKVLQGRGVRETQRLQFEETSWVIRDEMADVIPLKAGSIIWVTF